MEDTPSMSNAVAAAPAAESDEVVGVYSATGRRKTATAVVRLKRGTGKWTVNSRSLTDYFRMDALIGFIQQPMRLTGTLDKYDVWASVLGGGLAGQAGALRHAIARALTMADPSLRKILRDNGFLTRDPRMKERKKAGRPGARKRFQFSKR